MKLPNKNVTLKSARSREEWHKNRSFAVGASDVSTLFGLNNFTNVVELFWNRVRLTAPLPHNENSYSGELHEELIMKKYFVYHDPTNPVPERTIENAEHNKKLRAVQRFHRGIFMKDIPLSCTLDYLCLPDQYAPQGAIVEVKNMLGYVIKQYDANIIPGHLLQVQAQLMCTGLDLAYLVYYIDGRFFRCYPIEKSLDIQSEIRERVTQFWNERVLPARKVWNDPNLTEQQKMLQIYEEFEPPVDPTAHESLQEFMNVRFREIAKLGKLIVSDDLQILIDGYKDYREKETSSAVVKNQYGNEIRSAMIANSCDEVANSQGKVIASYRVQSDGKTVLRVN